MSGSELRFRLAGRLGAGLFGLLGRSYRYDLEGAEHLRSFREKGRPVVFVFWHRWILPLAWLHRGEGVVVLVSEHGDGEYITRVIHRLGFGTARGSSTRGGVRGLKAVVRAIRSGRDVVLTPDGPRGPACRFKPGALAASQLTGAPVISVTVDASTAWRLGSWDGFVIPRPFARVRVRYGAAIQVAPKADAEALADLAGVLEGVLGRETSGPPNVGPDPRASARARGP